MSGAGLPFDAVVGQEEAKLALRLAAVDPRIGGVLLRGEKGSGKTTLARGMAQLAGGPFVELPLSATEDRLVGTLDTHAALVGGEIRFQPGLLAAAHGGVLYVDEINLLADHLVDALLDVAACGENVLERDGVSHRHPARFVLVGSMNPEEGELRPQLLDRFGLCVEVTCPVEPEQRVEAVRRRLAFDAGSPTAAPGRQAPPAARVQPAALTEEILLAASRLALAVGAEGLRADLTLCRAAAALAGIDGRARAELSDLRRVAALALAHRRRRGPFDPPVVPPEQLDQALGEALGPPPADGGRDQTPEGRADRGGGHPGDDAGGQGNLGGGLPGGGPPGGGDRPLAGGDVRRPPVEAPRRQAAPRGRYVRDEPASGASVLAAVPTVRSVAARRARDPRAGVERSDLRSAVREGPASRTIVLCFDLSGSMGAPERAAAASGTAIGLLTDAYQRRDQVALVTFRGEGAEVALSPTSSVEVARNRLGELATGGRTPLAAGLAAALGVAQRGGANESLLVLLSDGRATGAPGEFGRALEVARTVRRAGVRALVLDCETGSSRLGLCGQLAAAMGGRCVHVSDLDPGSLARAIRRSC